MKKLVSFFAALFFTGLCYAALKVNPITGKLDLTGTSSSDVSGEANRAMLFNNGGTIDGSDMYFDTNTYNFGIGISTPETNLHISNAGPTGILFDHVTVTPTSQVPFAHFRYGPAGFLQSKLVFGFKETVPVGEANASGFFIGNSTISTSSDTYAAIINMRPSTIGLPYGMLEVRNLSLGNFFGSRTVLAQPDVLVSSYTLKMSSVPPNMASIVAVTTTSSGGQVYYNQPFTTFYDYLFLGSPSSVNNSSATYETSYASHPAYGRAYFRHDITHESNSVTYMWDVPRNFDTAEPMRIENFTILLGSVADTGTQRFYIELATGTASKPLTGMTFSTYEIAVDFAADASGGALDLEVIGSTQALTGWAAAITPGDAVQIRVGRDGDSAQDASTVNSYLRSIQLRFGRTSP